MVLPITGPTTRAETSGDYYSNGSVWRVRQVYRQAKPYTIPLPYSMFSYTQVSGKATSYATGDSWGAHWLGQWWTSSSRLNTSTGNSAYEIPKYNGASWSELTNVQNLVLNRAREKFFSKANQRVSLVVDILQRKQAYNMLVKRVTQAATAFGQMRKLRFRDALQSLGIKKPAGWRPATSDLGSFWLEYSYGWKPLVNDIYEAAKVLSAPLDPQWIQESRSEVFDRLYSHVYVGGANNYDATYRNKVILKVFARVGGVVSLANPNLQALKNAGLTNPFAWIWELLPFSFVADWFGSVGDFIESLDDTVGLTITDGFYSYGMNGTSRVSAELVRPYGGWPKPPLPGRAVGDGGWKLRSVASMTRIRGIPTVKLVRKLKILTNLDRGLNAASLLAQTLRNPPKSLMR